MEGTHHSHLSKRRSSFQHGDLCSSTSKGNRCCQATNACPDQAYVHIVAGHGDVESSMSPDKLREWDADGVTQKAAASLMMVHLKVTAIRLGSDRGYGSCNTISEEEEFCELLPGAILAMDVHPCLGSQGLTRFQVGEGPIGSFWKQF